MALPKLNKSWIVLLASILFAVMAVFAVKSYVQNTINEEKARLRPNEETVEVMVVKTDVKRGVVVSSDLFAVRKVPKTYTTGGTITPNMFNSVEGARVSVDMRGGEMLLKSSLEGADVTTFATKIKPGIRAMTIAVDDLNSISGMLQPGDKVDLFLTFKTLEAPGAGSGARKDQTRLLMQQLPVMATGKQVRPNAGDAVLRAFTNITVEVTLLDAQKLILAQKAGTISAVLRNPTDSSPAGLATLDTSLFTGTLPLPRKEFSPTKIADVTSTPYYTEVYVGGRGGAGSRQLIPLESANAAVPVQDEGVSRSRGSSRVGSDELTPAQLQYLRKALDAMEAPAGIDRAPVQMK
jgi:pilus assembly protein CpaB